MGVRQADLKILSAAALTCSAAVLAATIAVTLAIAGGSSDVLRWPFRLMCHGQLDRAFAFAGIAMPLCARCVGIYAGIAGAALFVFISAPRSWSRRLRVLGTALVVPLVIDGSAQTFALWSTGNAARAATGLAFGFGLVILGINGVVSKRDPQTAGTPRTDETAEGRGEVSY